MCYIWCGIFPMDFTTTIDIVPQSVAFLLQSVVFPMNFPKTNCSIVLQHIIVYHKNSILLQCDLLAVKTGLLYLDSNQGRQIAGLNALPLSYRVSQVLTSYVRF